MEHETEVQTFTSVGAKGSQRGYKAYCSCGWSARAEWTREEADEHIRRHLEQVAP